MAESPSGAGLLPQPPTWPVEDDEETVSLGLKCWLPAVSEFDADPGGSAGLRLGTEYLAVVPLYTGFDDADQATQYDNTYFDPTVCRIDVSDVGTWGGWPRDGGRPAGWSLAGWEQAYLTFAYGIDAADGVFVWGGPGDLRPGEHGRMNVVRAGPSVMTPGERVTLRVVGGGFDASHASTGKVWLYHEGALVAESTTAGKPRVVEFDLANARRYRAFEVDVQLPDDAPLGVYDIEVKIGDIAVAEYKSGSTMGTRWNGDHGGLVVERAVMNIPKMDLVAWRPQNLSRDPVESPRYGEARFYMEPRKVPDDEEDRETVPQLDDGTPGLGSPGAGIRAQQAFLEEAVNHDDLVQFDVIANASPNQNAEFILRKTVRELIVYAGTPTNRTPILGWYDDEVTLDLATTGPTLWVGWLRGSQNSVNVGHIELVWRSATDGDLVGDRIRFYRFTSAIFGWPGEKFWGTVDTTKPYHENGVYRIGDQLIDQGHDVHLMEEDYGDYPPIYLLARLRGQGRITSMALFGHSHGAGQLHNYLVMKNTDGDPFDPAYAYEPGVEVRYVAYIDAVKQPYTSWRDENRRPPAVGHLANYYQTYGSPHSSPIIAGADSARADFELNVTLEPWGATLDHGGIQQSPITQNCIIRGVTNTIQEGAKGGLLGHLDR